MLYALPLREGGPLFNFSASPYPHIPMSLFFVKGAGSFIQTLGKN